MTQPGLPRGTVVVQGERTLRSPTPGDLVVAPGAVACVRAATAGDVIVQPGGRCHLLAPVAGHLHVDRGTVVLDAPVAGGVSLTDGTRPDAVRRARRRAVPGQPDHARPVTPDPPRRRGPATGERAQRTVRDRHDQVDPEERLT